MTIRVLSLLALAACGSTGHATDAGGDAPPAGDVTITAVVRCCERPVGAPQIGVHVIVVQPGGSPGDSGMTDVEGNLVLHGVQRGASISAVYPRPAVGPQQVTTFIGVQPGDHLTLGDRYGDQGTLYFIPPLPLDQNIFVELPAVDGTQWFSITTSCTSFLEGGPGPVSFPVSFASWCQDATGPLLVVAMDPLLNPFATAFVPAAPFIASSTITITDFTPNSADNFTMSISGLRAQVAQVELDAVAAYGGPIALVSATPPAAPATGALISSATIPAAPPRVVTHASMQLEPEFGLVDSYRAIAGTEPSITLSPPTLPVVGGALADPAAGQATWLQSDGDYDATVLGLSWISTDPQEGPQAHHWTVILPPGTSSFELGEQLSVVPISSPAPPSFSVELIDIASVQGYDELRALPEWAITDPGAAAIDGYFDAADTAANEGPTTSVRRVARAGYRASSR